MKEKNRGTLMLFGDSFSDKLIPFLKHHFSKIIFFSTRKIDHDLVRLLKPDFVVHQICERFYTDAYIAKNYTLSKLEKEDGQILKFDNLDDYFEIKFSEGIVHSNYRSTENILDTNFFVQRKNGVVSGQGVFSGWWDKKPRLIFNMNKRQGLGQTVELEGQWLSLPERPLEKPFVNNQAIISIRSDGREIKVAFFKEGIVYGGALPSNFLALDGLYNDFRLKLSLTEGQGILKFNDNHVISWSSGPAPGDGVFIGDFEPSGISDFALKISKLRIYQN
tara:strand:- start:76 stop:906 length:831 start_codon:yes stop_codon:yes gene_type:complete